jgi:hypothetical protein
MKIYTLAPEREFSTIFGWIYTLYTHPNKFREQKLKMSSRGITLLKNHRTMIKFELDLRLLMIFP